MTLLFLSLWLFPSLPSLSISLFISLSLSLSLSTYLYTYLSLSRSLALSTKHPPFLSSLHLYVTSLSLSLSLFHKYILPTRQNTLYMNQTIIFSPIKLRFIVNRYLVCLVTAACSVISSSNILLSKPGDSKIYQKRTLALQGSLGFMLTILMKAYIKHI